MRNVTLRNVSNILKGINEVFGLSETVAVTLLQSSNKIFESEFEYMSQRKKYEMDYKVDLLSTTSLFWKIN